MIPTAWIDLAERRLEGQIEQTPLTYDPDLDLYVKWENRQTTGSFKIRGAFNKVLSLESWERQRGLVTASAGNHGQGVALAAGKIGAPVTVFASAQAVSAKIAAMRAYGAEVRLVEGGYAAAENAGKAYAAATGAVWISPYNDGQIVAGQATLGTEILRQLSPVVPSAVIVPVGGGGMIAGIGAVLSHTAPRPRLVGVQSDASPFFHALYHHGTQAGAVELDSLADGLAGAVEEGSITIPMVRKYVDALELVTEDQIAAAIAFAWRKYNEKIEGSAAVALAYALKNAPSRPDGPWVVVVSGGNIQPEIHAQICADKGEPAKNTML